MLSGGINTPTAGSFDTRQLLGRSEKAATTQVVQHGCSIRMISRDGHGYVLTADAVPNRVDVTVDAGVVTSVSVG